ncbi:hypothetical protein [Streptomyces sp. AM8-1-1]|uniref:hypothetical protein n=1 Tax=Streptomyces sp. AM8-1-1 TaxID=3075825 RepID=UPI0028C4F87E|nr:hypothetical protein [Streptomyces sp. AM8-1-1]WNO73959.1 hypothetical protein RPQ07_21065 [Streptomyces sp. AM8-1-1]
MSTEPERRIPRWGPRNVTAAAAASTVQLAVVAPVLLTLDWFTRDDYGATPEALGLLCLLLFGPLLAATAGLVHSVALTLPAMTAAWWASRRAGGPEWRWHLAAVVVMGALLAIPCAVLGAGYLVSWAGIAASGVFPALVVAYFRRREGLRGKSFTRSAIWLRASGIWVLLAAVASVTFVVAVERGFVAPYEPPRLTREELTGTWEGTGEAAGAVLRLDANGRASFIRLPHDGNEARVPGPCDGSGSWALHSGSARQSVDIGMGDCSDVNASWMLGGTRDRPELSRFLGEADLRILVRHGSR